MVLSGSCVVASCLRLPHEVVPEGDCHCPSLCEAVSGFCAVLADVARLVITALLGLPSLSVCISSQHMLRPRSFVSVLPKAPPVSRSFLCGWYSTVAAPFVSPRCFSGCLLAVSLLVCFCWCVLVLLLAARSSDAFFLVVSCSPLGCCRCSKLCRRAKGRLCVSISFFGAQAFV